MGKVFKTSERRSCLAIGFARSTYRCRMTRDVQAVLRLRIRDIAASRPRYGYRRIHVLLRREGWDISHKRVYRIYCEEGLHLRSSKNKRKKVCAARIPGRNAPTAENECWAMDFVSDQLYDGKRFRALTLIDTYTRECLVIYSNRSITGEMAADALDELKTERRLPKRIKVDNGPEFISRSLDAWAYFNSVKLDCSRPGTLTDNAHIESFNGSFRDECLNTNWFMSLGDAADKMEEWRIDYNEWRPHSALSYLIPTEYAKLRSA